jgi:hypothetical protein
MTEGLHWKDYRFLVYKAKMLHGSDGTSEEVKGDVKPSIEATTVSILFHFLPSLGKSWISTKISC